MNREWEVGQSDNPLTGKTVQDFIYFEGMYNPILRFAFTNVLDEDFVSYWNGNPYTIKPHQSVKLPHHLAVKFTKEIVDKQMQKEGRGLAMIVPANRKPYEDKVLAILPSEKDSELQIIKNEFIEQIQKDANRQLGVADEPIEAPMLEFDDLSPKNFGDKPKKKK